MRNYIDLYVARTDGVLPNPDHPEEPISNTTFWVWGSEVDDVEDKRREYEAILNGSLDPTHDLPWIFEGGYPFDPIYGFSAASFEPVKYFFLINLDNLVLTFQTFIGGAFLNEADWKEQCLRDKSPRDTWAHGH